MHGLKFTEVEVYMTNHSKKRNISRNMLIIFLVITVALSFFMLTSCNNNKIDVASLGIVEETLPQNIKVSDFDISKIKLAIKDSEGNESFISANSAMLTTESRNMLTEAGEHNITLIYQQKPVTFTINLFDDNAELVVITFKDKYNNVIETQTIVKGGSVVAPNHPIIEGMLADGWIDENGDEASLSTINEDIELFPKYEKDIEFHTVTFKDFEGNKIGTVQVEDGSKIGETVSYQQPDEVKSWAWYYGNSKLDIDDLKVVRDITITMRVEEYITHTVTFQYINDENQIINLGSEEVKHGNAALGEADARNELVSDGYNFISWDKNFNNVRMDLTVNATAVINSFTVVFKSEGNVLKTQTIKYGHDASAPITGVSEKTGYYFTNTWNGGSLFNVTQNLELTAVYEPMSFTVSIFDKDQDEQAPIVQLQKIYGSVINTDNIGDLTSKEDNILVGIYEDKELTIPVELPYTITKSRSLYTKWIDTTSGNTELVYISDDNNEYKSIVSYDGDPILYIPSTNGELPVKYIAESVFENMDIQKVVFGSNIVNIGNYAFRNTMIEGKLTIPEGVTEIGVGAFANCENITEVILPSTLEKLGAGAFSGDTALASISFADGTNFVSLNERVFQNCTSLSSISLPTAVTTIDQYAFAGSGIISINLSNIININTFAFNACNSLSNLTNTDLVEKIESEAFENTAITEIYLPSIKELGTGAFAFAKELKNVHIGASLPKIKTYTFRECLSLTNIIFDTEEYLEDENIVVYGIKEIESCAFMDSKNIKEIYLPKSLETVSAYSFTNTLKMNAFNVDPDNENFIDVDGILYNYDITSIIAYPSGKIVSNFILPETVTTICEGAFKKASIAKLVIPPSISKIESYAFDSNAISIIEFLGSQPSECANNIFNNALWKLYVSTTDFDTFSDEVFSAKEEKPEGEINELFYIEI